MNCCDKHKVSCDQGRSCPARSCDALGLCQDRTPRCEGCEPPSPASEVYSVITWGVYALIAVVLAGAVGLIAGVLAVRL